MLKASRKYDVPGADTGTKNEKSEARKNLLAHLKPSKSALRRLSGI